MGFDSNPRPAPPISIFQLNDGKEQTDSQAAIRPIDCDDASTVQANRTVCDCESEAKSAGLALPRVVDTIEGSKNRIELFCGNSRTAIADTQLRLPAVIADGLGEVDFDGAIVGRIAKCVAQDVFKSAFEQTRISADNAVLAQRGHNPASAE